ncbi:hypothetical protein [Hoeflea olei]|uniref:UDP-N-acetylglucosamine 2-epimerase domain-containing protein n=1 Tax=Hoeflea olei TaxID=1480615 RepID=A0A1C1YU85_9HYPH|nr:hypothetical protein [Hoeflea olei]OCW56995.1 hypothetical protein AWJ14_07520 [Hoeflea olei]
MHTRKTIIFSARDAAAALYAAPIIELALGDDRFRVVVVAQEPALSILRRRSITSIAVELPAAESAGDLNAAALLSQAELILQREQPDVVIAGLSSPGQGGIDEALLQMRSCTGFLLQDFWGEWNGFFGRKPDLFLVLDEAAAALTRQAHGIDCVVVGSTRHADYAALEMLKTRQTARTRIGASGRPLIGWFGQALHDVPGYSRSMAAWSRAVRDFPVEVDVVYKPHPRESADQRQRTLELMRACLPEVHFLEAWPIEDSLLLCDCVCAVMSNCLYDAAYLNFHSPAPLVTPVAMLHSAELHADLSSKIAFEALPYIALGLAKVALPGSDLGGQLFSAMSEEGKRDCWQAARRNLADPSRAAAHILDLVRSHGGGS